MKNYGQVQPVILIVIFAVSLVALLFSNRKNSSTDEKYNSVTIYIDKSDGNFLTLKSQFKIFIIPLLFCVLLAIAFILKRDKSTTLTLLNLITFIILIIYIVVLFRRKIIIGNSKVVVCHYLIDYVYPAETIRFVNFFTKTNEGNKSLDPKSSKNLVMQIHLESKVIEINLNEYGIDKMHMVINRIKANKSKIIIDRRSHEDNTVKSNK